jgi:tetratricopeptide (TPR) repeat protein
MLHRRRFVLRVVLALLLVLLGAGGAWSAGVWLWARHHYQAAQEALAHHRIAEARHHIALCLKAWPKSGPAHFLAGRAARRDQDFAEADRRFKECYRLQGWAFPLATEYALIRVQQGDVDKPEAYFRREIDNGNPEAGLYLEAFVEGYLYVRRLSEASVCLDRWEKIQPDNMYVYFLRGSLWERIPKRPEATEEYRKVLELNPDYAEARLRLARILIEAHEYEEALTQVMRLRQQQPDNPTARVYLAQCYLGLARAEEARPLLEQVLQQNPRDSGALFVSAQLALQEGHAEQAEALLRQLLTIEPHEREAIFLLAKCLRQLGKGAEAEEQTARFRQIDADWRKLQELTTVKMGTTPHDPELRYQVGVILRRLGEDKAAVEWFQRALQTDPQHEPSRKALAELSQRNGEARSATTAAPSGEVGYIRN